MVGYALLAFAFAALFAYLAVDPRRRWWRSAARRYRNPQAVEPSDAAFRSESVTMRALAVVMVILGIVLLFVETPQAREARQEQERTECADILAELGTIYESEQQLEPLQRRAAELGVEVEMERPLPGTERPSEGVLGALYDQQRESPLVFVRKGDDLLGTLGGFGGRDAVRASC